MKADLLKVKERLEYEGLIENIRYNSDDNILIINEVDFFYDNSPDINEHYYISITTDSNKNFYVVNTFFETKEFFDNYDNQIDYIRKIVKEMNSELGYNNLLLSNENLNNELNEVLNNELSEILCKNTIKSILKIYSDNEHSMLLCTLGKYLIKSILEKYGADSDSMLFWVNQEFLKSKGNLYTKEDASEIFTKAFYLNKECTLEYIKSLFGLKNNYNPSIYEYNLLDSIVSKSNRRVSSCYWNSYASKFMPKDMLKEALYEISSIPKLYNVKICKNNGEYIEVYLNKDSKLRIVTENNCYTILTIQIPEDDRIDETIDRIENISSLNDVIEYIKDMLNKNLHEENQETLHETN